MPPLRHSVPGEPFDIRKSEVVQWLVRQPEILQYIFDRAHDTGSIVYDPETERWCGADYGD